MKDNLTKGLTNPIDILCDLSGRDIKKEPFLQKLKTHLEEEIMPRDFFEELKDFNPNSLSGDHFSIYQAVARTTAVYPKEFGIYYVALGLAGEAGEFANKVKKIMRDGLSITPELKKNLGSELGDCLWYIANACEELGISLKDVADENLEKLLGRKDRGKLGGTGDNR